MFGKNKTALIVALVVGSVAVAYVMLAYLPGRESMVELRQELIATQGMLADAKTAVGLIPETEAELSVVQGYRDHWRHCLPKPDDVVDVFAELSRIAVESGATTTRFEPRETIIDTALSRTPLHIDGTGSFSELAIFIRAIDDLPHLVWTDELKLEAQQQAGGDVQFELELVIFGEQTKISE